MVIGVIFTPALQVKNPHLVIPSLIYLSTHFDVCVPNFTIQINIIIMYQNKKLQKKTKKPLTSSIPSTGHTRDQQPDNEQQG